MDFQSQPRQDELTVASPSPSWSKPVDPIPPIQAPTLPLVLAWGNGAIHELPQTIISLPPQIQDVANKSTAIISRTEADSMDGPPNRTSDHFTLPTEQFSFSIPSPSPIYPQRVADASPRIDVFPPAPDSKPFTAARERSLLRPLLRGAAKFTSFSRAAEGTKSPCWRCSDSHKKVPMGHTI